MRLNKNYWENRYINHDDIWNVGDITTPLKEYIDQIEDKSLKILVPGCGNGYEFEYLMRHGFQNSFVLDFADIPLENVKQRVTNASEYQFIRSDFFDHHSHYNLIIEQTFFCALDPKLRAKYVKKMHDLLLPKGKLIGLLFQFPLTEAGPPFGGSKEEYLALFSEYFEIKTLETAHNSIKPRQGSELFFIFTKK